MSNPKFAVNTARLRLNQGAIALSASSVRKMVQFTKESKHYVVRGLVEPGYEAVCDRFCSHFESGVEECAQVCAFVKGKVVVDLWGGVFDPEKEKEVLYGYNSKSIQNLFSSSKVVSSFVFAMLNDRGVIKYDQLVSEVWPEYAQNGKATTTIKQVLQHEAGLSEFKPMDPRALTRAHIKAGEVSSYIESLEPSHKPGEQRIYHPFSRGMILNEIIRRADPKGRTIGEFIEEEIAQPLNLENQLILGASSSVQRKMAPVTPFNNTWNLFQYFWPRALGGSRFYIESFTDRLFTPLVFFMTKLHGIFVTPMEPLVVPENSDIIAGSVEDNTVQMYNTAEVRSCEFPSGNVHASARALATLAANIAEKGNIENSKGIISRNGVEDAMGGAAPKTMKLVGLFYIPSCFTNAGWNLFKGDRYGYAGWMGYGGSVAQWHMEERIGFGYAMTKVDMVSMDNSRAKILQKLVVECARSIRQEK